MQLGLFSACCFHCVDLDQFPRPDVLILRVGNLAGTPCPLCGTIIGDLFITADGGAIEKINTGTANWYTKGCPPGFGGFFPNATKPPSSSEIARALRSQLSGAPSERRRRMCEIGTTVLVRRGVVATWLNEAEEQGDIDRTRMAYRAIVDYGEGSISAAAAIQLGQIEQKSGDEAEAIRLYRMAAETSDRRLRPVAFLYLGDALDEAGDTVGARRAFRECVDCGESAAQADATYRLGNMLELEDPTAARELYENVLAHGDRTCSAGAAVNLGVIYEAEGRHTEAKQRWEYAFDNGDERERTVAAFNLGRLYERGGRTRKAKLLYQIAAASPQPDVVRRAKEWLASWG